MLWSRVSECAAWKWVNCPGARQGRRGQTKRTGAACHGRNLDSHTPAVTVRANLGA